MIKTKPKFEIGQEIKDGIICAVYTARFYTMTNDKYPYDPWTKLDPKWIEKFVYAIKLNNPTKNCSFEEYQMFYPEIDYVILEEKYNALPLYSYMYLPEMAINE